METEGTREFAEMIEANLAYWQKRASELQDEQFKALNLERGNIHVALQYALSAPSLWKPTSELVLQLFEFVELYGYWDDWIDVIKKTIAICPPDELLIKARLYNRLGFLYRLKREFGVALETHLIAKEYAQAARDDFETFYTNFFMSDDCLMLHRYEQAETYGTLAEKGFSKIKANGSERAGTLNTLGLIAHAQGKLDLAERRFAEAIPLWDACGKLIKRAHSLNNLSNTLLANNKPQQALERLQTALALLETFPSKLLEASLRISIGNAHYSIKQYEQAEESFRQVDTAYLKQTGQYYPLAITLNNIAQIYLIDPKRLAEAEAYLKESIKWCDKANHLIDKGNTVGDLARAVFLQGRTEEALRYYDEAILLLSDFSNNAWANNRLKTLKAQRQEIEMGLVVTPTADDHQQ